MKRIAISLMCALTLLSTYAHADRFTELTGAKTRVDRIYTCHEISMWDAIHLRMLRDATTSDEVKERTISRINQADDFGFNFMVMLEEYSSDEFNAASRNLSKKFTDKELSQLVEEYGSLLKAHCADLLE